MSGADFIVVGAGIAGASAAYSLSEHGRVIVLERETAAGYHTTGRSAAQFLESYGNQSTRCLTRAGRAFLESPPDGFADGPILSPRGALFFATEAQREALAGLHESVRTLTPTVQMLDGEAAREVVPALRSGVVVAAMYEPDSMSVDVHALHQGFMRGARRRGAGIVLDAEVAAVRRRAGRWQVTTRGGEFSAPHLVNAAGAWCDEVAAAAGAGPIGLVPKRRTVFTFDPGRDDTARWPLTIDATEEVYFKPETGQLLCSPADETPSPPCDAQPEEIDVAIAVDRLERVTTLTVPRIQRRWAGLRSFVADHSLVIGPDPVVEGFWWVAAQGGYGIQTSPAASRAIAGLVCGDGVPADLLALGLDPSDLDPGRRSLRAARRSGRAAASVARR